ncbi:MAG: DUF2271 domain-containing protein [Bacteroidota bacterium]
MHKIYKNAWLGLLLLGTICFMAMRSPQATSQYKCLVQMTNYDGEGPYFVVSVLDKEGKYLQTLHVSGEDEDWYPDLEEWWSYKEDENPDVDAITRPSVPAGGRSVFSLSIDDDWQDVGYQLRFETAVEDQKYVKNDLTMPLTATNLNGKFEGSGYIRYVRIIPQ